MIRGVLLTLVLALVGGVKSHQTQDPYSDIASLLSDARDTTASLDNLDRPAPTIQNVVHTHHHLVSDEVPRRVAERLAQASVPQAAPVAVVKTSVVEPPIAAPTFSASFTHTVTAPRPVRRTRKVFSKSAQLSAIAKAAAPKTPTWTVKGAGYHFPLVDRRKKQTTFTVVAETDGSDKAIQQGDPRWKPHTSEELEAEAKKLLQKAKEVSRRRLAAKKAKAQQIKEDNSLGVFDAADANYEDEITRLARVSARMNRLLEQIQQPRLTDSFEQSIARKRFLLKLYHQLKSEVTEIMESYALRTGNSIMSLFGDEPMDPNLAAFLPPNSVAAILNRYANPTQTRDDENPRDLISGREAKRIQHKITHWNSVKNGLPAPPLPTYSKTVKTLGVVSAPETSVRPGLPPFVQNPNVNMVLANQQGVFGANRPGVTFGDKIGHAGVHINVVNPTPTQDVRGLPFRMKFNNLKKEQQPGATPAPAQAPAPAPAQ